ncbi:hypothetical protein DFJ58DRAFT_733590 [Suillus subalutaceus]|uniref:uncharacterized protein n=1 Tax=Suillus subalutaceus TaxID=48586 RepID=UPI001B863C8D|nr:uncharacterized protein DFJ58DRAFT_733590 [Suillus subalutaceus]KAG1838855.1 hypothetical protein DFJ58DRAFT_733590 [Suillus subalutaceus]
MSITQLPCHISGCKQIFKNKSGLTKHLHTLHPDPLHHHRTFHQAAPPPPHFPSPEHHNFDDAPLPATADTLEHQGDANGFILEEGTYVQFGPLLRAFHPRLTGLKCDIDGNTIDQTTPPPP